MRISLALSLWACTGTEPADDTDPTTDPPAEIADDADAVRELIAGTRATADVVSEISWQGGWPVTEDGTAWFVVPEDGATWALAGDFNDWTPEPMTFVTGYVYPNGDVSPGFWYAEVSVPTPAGVRYKLVRDEDTWLADPGARSYTYDDNGEISYVRPPTDTWRLDRWVGLIGHDPSLFPRDLRVYVPPGEGPFPVIVAHDAQNLFDPEGIWGGWHLQDALSALDTPVLAVGVDNTSARMSEYTPWDDLDVRYPDGGEYVDTIVDDILPHIGSAYPINDTTGILGSSLGGLISVYAGYRRPEAFDFVASLSGTLAWGRIEGETQTIQERYFSDGPNGVPMYVDSGGGGPCTDTDGDGFTLDEGSDNYCANREFADTLADLGWTWEQNLWHWHEAGAPHNEAAWAARVHRPLEIFADIAAP